MIESPHHQHHHQHQHKETMMFVQNYGRLAISMATLNNDAVREVQKTGNYGVAYQLLSTALSTTKNSIRQLQSDGLCMDTTMDADCRIHHKISYGNLIDLSPFHSCEGEEQGQLQDHGCCVTQEDCYLHRHPIQMNVKVIEQQMIAAMMSKGGSSHNHHHQSSMMAILEVLALTIVFNLAIVHHLHAVAHNYGRDDTSTTTSSTLHRSVALYQQALRLIDSSSSLPNTFQVVIIAALNNIGHIYHTLGNFQQSRQSFEQLATAISMYGKVDDDEDKSTTTGEDGSTNTERRSRRANLNDGFLSNVWLLFLKCNTAAAA